MATPTQQDWFVANAPQAAARGGAGGGDWFSENAPGYTAMPQHGAFGPPDVTRLSPQSPASAGGGAQATGSIRAERVSDLPWYDKPSAWLNEAGDWAKGQAEKSQQQELANRAAGVPVPRQAIDPTCAYQFAANAIGDALHLGSGIATPKGAAITAASMIPYVGRVVQTGAGAYYGGKGMLGVLREKQPGETNFQFMKRVNQTPDLLQQDLLATSMLAAAVEPALKNVSNTVEGATAASKAYDSAGKLVRNADRMANIRQGLLGLYQGKVYPTLNEAWNRIRSAENDAYNSYKAKALLEGDTDITPNKSVEVPAGGASQQVQQAVNREINGRAHNLDSWISAKNRIYAMAARASGADQHYLSQVHDAMLDDLDEHAQRIGAQGILDDAREHSKARFDLEKGPVAQALDNPYPTHGTHEGLIKDLLGQGGKSTAVADSIYNQLKRLDDSYGTGQLAEKFKRDMTYAKQLNSMMDGSRVGFMGVFRSMMSHPIPSIVAWSAMGRMPWVLKMLGINQVGQLASHVQAGHLLNDLRANINDPAAFQEKLNLGVKPRDYGIDPEDVKLAQARQGVFQGTSKVHRADVASALENLGYDKRTAAAAAARTSGGTFEEHFQNAQNYVRSPRTGAKPVGADVARTSGTFGTSQEMNAGLARALGEEGTPEAIEAKRAEAAKRARRRAK